MEARVRPTGKSLSTRFAALIRWLHIYVSLLSFTALVSFGLTGITLNHPTWFGADAQHVTEHRGSVITAWLATAPGVSTDASDSEPVPESVTGKLEIVEHLRATHALRGAVSEFRVDERECLILMKGPGYAADTIVDRESGAYTVTVTTMGPVAILNDLHKGRDTGSSWSIVIDVVSIVTVFVSLTGLLLIFYIRRKRTSGILTAIAGTIAIVAIALWLVP